MSIARNTILRGPAVVQFNSQTFWSKDDIEVTLDPETFNIETSAHGKVDERLAQRVCEVRFTPAGEWEALATLFPYGAMVVGTSVFGATDKPLVIHTLDGKKLTFKAAALTQVPDLILSATKTMFGPLVFTCIGADNTAWTTADSLLAVSSQAFSDATFTTANVLTQPYAAAWGASAPWDAIQTAEGWTISHELTLDDVETDADGIVDKTFGQLAVLARCRPLGITEAHLIAALGVQGSGNVRGRSLNAGANDLAITGTGVAVTLTKAALKTAGYAFGPSTLRIGEVGFVATRTNAATSLISIGTGA